ncbi:hypothetical protein ACWGB8_37595 [Kitasatospora sp. NPDC054939]
MNGVEKKLSEELEALAESTAPISRVDAGSAVAQGRARLRRRRFAVAGAVAACAITVAAVSSVLPDRTVGGAAPAAPGGASGSPSASLSTGPVPSRGAGPIASGSPWSSPTAGLPRPSGGVPSPGPSTFAATGPDPLTTEATFGWLPEGFTGGSYLKTSIGNQARANAPQEGELRNSPTLWLKVYPSDPGVGTFATGDRQYRVPAPAVNGREAYWVGSAPDRNTALGGAERYLRWQAADGRWAELQSMYLDKPDTVQVMHRVAGGVTVGHTEVPLPFTVRNLPAGAGLHTVDMQRGGWVTQGVEWMASISFELDGRYLGVYVAPDGPSQQPSLRPGAPDANPDCKVEKGLRICAASIGDKDVYKSVGGAAKWLERFTLLGTDPAAWTTRVIS